MMTTTNTAPETFPTITLGRITYRVERASEHMLVAIGPRGGRSLLVQNKPNPSLYGAVGGALAGKWYRLADGAFEAVSY